MSHRGISYDEHPELLERSDFRRTAAGRPVPLAYGSLHYAGRWHPSAPNQHFVLQLSPSGLSHSFVLDVPHDIGRGGSCHPVTQRAES